MKFVLLPIHDEFANPEVALKATSTSWLVLNYFGGFFFQRKHLQLHIM